MSRLFAALIAAALASQSATLAKASSRFKYQRRVMDGGTCEATAFGVAGFQVAGISTPLKNYHNMSPSGRPEPEADLSEAWSIRSRSIRSPASHRSTSRSACGNPVLLSRRLYSLPSAVFDQQRLAPDRPAEPRFLDPLRSGRREPESAGICRFAGGRREVRTGGLRPGVSPGRVSRDLIPPGPESHSQSQPSGRHANGGTARSARHAAQPE